MKILHVCNIEHENSNGISGIVPQYVFQQSKYEDVELLNLTEKRTMQNKKYDLIVIHGVYEMNTLLFFYRYVFGRFKYVFVPHGGLSKLGQSKSPIKKCIANKVLFRQFYKNAEAIQFLSDNEMNNSIYVGNNKFIVCPSGILLPEKRLYKIHRRDSFVFIYIGRITIFYKGLDLLLKAISLVREQLIDNNVSFKIIGVNNDDEPLDLLYKIIDDGKIKDIISFDFQGRFGEEKIRELLDADCFIQTSRSEGLPLGILEALSLGMPLAVTNPVGFSDIIDNYNCGFHCEARVEDIANMLCEVILKKNSLEEKSSNSYKAASVYGWESVTRNTLDHYYKLVKGERFV